MSPDDPRHGTQAGYSAHKRDGEKPCHACEKAKQREDKRRRVFGPSLIPLPPDLQRFVAETSIRTLARATGLAEFTLWNIRKRGEASRVRPETLAALRRVRIPSDVGTVRRVRALSALGWSSVEIGHVAGVRYETVTRIRDHAGRTMLGQDQLRYKIAAAYDQLSMTAPGVTRWSSRIKNAAERNGWAPPLAWDDIDDPDATPDLGEIKYDSRGRPVVRDALIEDAEWLADDDLHLDVVVERLGVTRDNFHAACRRAGRLDLYHRLARRLPYGAGADSMAQHARRTA